jgi:hypothetical protein
MRVLPSVFGSLMLMAFALSPLSANASIDEDAILHEVREFYAGYIRSYTSQKSQDLADNYMIAPLYFRNFEDVVFLQNRQEVVDYLASVFSKMTDQDYESSEILANNFCVLTETSAIVSIAFRRFNSNGDTILESGASYSLFKFDGSWRIAMLSSHPSENIVSCEGSGKLSI